MEALQGKLYVKLLHYFIAVLLLIGMWLLVGYLLNWCWNNVK